MFLHIRTHTRTINNIQHIKVTLTHTREDNMNFDGKENQQLLKFDQDRKDYIEMFPGLNSFQLMAETDNCKSQPKIFYPRAFHCRGLLPESWQIKLEDLNNAGMCISMNPCEGNGKSRKAEDMIKCRAIVLDLDGSPLAPVMKDNPSMVVMTSPGRFHCYWMTEDVPLAGFSQLQKAVAKKFNGDPQCFDRSKAFRMPGFLHRKNGKTWVEIVEKNDRKFCMGELTEMFPPVKVRQFSAPQWQKKEVGNPDDPFRGVLGAGDGGRNCHLIKRLGGCKKRGLNWGQIEQEAYREGAACDPPMKESEIRGVLKSFRRYV